MAVPQKYKEIGDFHEYYSGKRTAPYLTIFVGGNHEASNYMFELFYGGWVAPNIYYLGAANVIRFGPLRIAGLSGIWKGYDYRKPHYERLPFNGDDIQSIYHVRELDVRKLLQIRTQVDVGLSHDWPRQVELNGDYNALFRGKKGFREDSAEGKLGNVAAKYVLDRLRPAYWFSSHLHVKYEAVIQHGEYDLAGQSMEGFSTQGPSHQAPQVSPSLGLDGAIVAPMVAEEDHTDDNRIPAPAEEASATVASSKLAGDKGPESSPADQKDVTPKTPVVASAEVTGANASTANAPATIDADANVTTPDATTSKAAASPVHDSLSPASRERADTQSRLLAWNNFHSVAMERERAETARILAERANDVPLPETSYNLTWKRVNTSKDGLDRTIMGTEKPKGEGTHENKKQKTQHQPNVANNSDEISLGGASESDRGSPVASRTANTGKTEVSGEPAGPIRGYAQALRGAKAEHSTAAGNVSGDVRNQLPASFGKPKPAPTPKNEPLPAAISNKLTEFLALDKCVPDRDFLQLLELKPISEPEGAVFEHPYRLQYDKEWLAITRVFADELHLGDPSTKIPGYKGDIHYKPHIEKEAEWIEENVVKPGKLDIPENFTITAPIYDPAVPVTTKEQPPEYPNPQTAQFCQLIGIENKFHLTDEERLARMEAGPRPEYPRSGGYGRFSRRGAGQNRSQQGGGRNGSGGGRSGGGGRGAGRGRGGGGRRHPARN